MNAKLSVFVICVEAIMYLLLYICMTVSLSRDITLISIFFKGSMYLGYLSMKVRRESRGLHGPQNLLGVY